MSADHTSAATAQARGPTLRDLDPAQALRLLGTVTLGRIVFTQHALPTIRPVNHIVHNGDIIVRTHHGTALAAYLDNATTTTGVVVAYEADTIDPDTRLGWSVVATGYARLITDPHQLLPYQRLQPWTGQATDCAVRIHPELITGRQLTR
ncbi:pyridoxamine 5'-phosphate oxidase family protein [Streptacidiphilus sp. EB129]|uniref:pyridoxamine 5'-phosphate oxidase family protein n=1 Tax=Streptacidiphilus sp. EB129 TaxID=3156262 RepID=UPI003518FE64